jgi:hypothetical protein
MFSFKRINNLAFAIITLSMLMASTSGEASAQQSEFERRAEAMRRARSRQVVPARSSAEAVETVRTASAEASVAPRRVQSATTSSGQAARKVNARSTNVRVAQVPAGSGVVRSRSNHTRAPRVAQNLAAGTVIDGGIMGETIVDGGYVDGGYGEEVVYEGEAGCDSCGSSGAYFDDCCGGSCGTDMCCGRGGCAPRDCWLTGLGGILRNGEYFFGATGFQEPIYTAPVDGVGEVQDSSFGFYGGVNFGVPLCRLTCGVLSGQIGVRSVQTNFSGNEFTPESRDQLFVTAGLYRRVDYGIQFGVVGDFLQDEFYGDASVSQIRADLGWVYAGGSVFGFRYTGAQEDDIIGGRFNNTPFSNQNVEVHDQYRFYFRRSECAGGYGELFAGWTEYDQTILGMDFDVPVSERLAIESNFTYFFSDDATDVVFGPRSNFIGSNANEAWNISVGFVYRPQGRRYYKNYDRPLFDVADNGTMLLRRSNE